MARAPHRTRNIWHWLFAIAAWAPLLIWQATPAGAQEAEAEPAADTTTAAEEAAEGEGVDSALVDPENTAAPEEEDSMLMWIIETSGWIGAVLLALSIYFVATAAQMFMELRSSVTMPPALLEECENHVKNKDLMGLYKTVKADSSFFANVMSAGLAELQHGLPEAREAVERVGDAQVIEMEKKISMLAVLGTLGPMIGLLGTLKGMIASFSVIATSDTQLKPSEVAGGISEALVLTFEGVALSVPAIYFFALFRNRIASLSTEAILMADDFLRRVNVIMRSKPAAA